jgi:hypothetical protein
MGVVLSLVVNIGLGHLFYRPRPFLVLEVHALLPQNPDSSLFSDHVAVGAALTMGLLLVRRRLGLASAALLILLAVGRVGAAVHYPTDVGVAALVGAASCAVLLPLRRPIASLVAVMATGERQVLDRDVGPGRAFVLRHGPLAMAAALMLTAAAGYGLRALQDHGKLAAARRQAALMHPSLGPPSEYPDAVISDIAAGRYAGTHALVRGNVTQVTRELDGDFHIRVESGGAFIVLEIIPEVPMSPPHVAQRISAWGVVRHDGLHNWWELHPLIGWKAGSLERVHPPANGYVD